MAVRLVDRRLNMFERVRGEFTGNKGMMSEVQVEKLG